MNLWPLKKRLSFIHSFINSVSISLIHHKHSIFLSRSSFSVGGFHILHVEILASRHLHSAKGGGKKTSWNFRKPQTEKQDKPADSRESALITTSAAVRSSSAVALGVLENVQRHPGRDQLIVLWSSEMTGRAWSLLFIAAVTTWSTVF